MPATKLRSRAAVPGPLLPPPYDSLHASVTTRLPPHRVITDPLRLLAWGTDASFYRLTPKLAIVADSEPEVTWLSPSAPACGTPVTFRAAGTSLSGQSVTDSVLLLLGDQWRRCDVAPDAATVTLQPGVIGAEANRRLARYGRKIGPDPASIDSGDDRWHRRQQLERHVLRHRPEQLQDVGTASESCWPMARCWTRAIRQAVPRSACSARICCRGWPTLASAAQNNAPLAARIRHKFRLKNTTGYSLNALVDFTDPLDVLAHLMIGSEGTLGFISEVTYRTVPDHADKASALILFDDLETACRAVTALKAAPVAAVELADRAALRSVENKRGMPDGIRALGPHGAALLVETRAADRLTLAAQIATVEAALSGLHTFEPVAFSTDPAECARFWNVRKGMFPSVGAVRAAGTTVIIEDVAFPVERLAEATLELQQPAGRARLSGSDHFRPRVGRQPAFRVHPGLQRTRRNRTLPPLHGRAVPHGGREIRRFVESRTWHRPQRGAVRRTRMGRRCLRPDATDQDAVRPARIAQSRRHHQRRCRTAHLKQPQADAAM